MISFVNAKINLGLNIVRKREDGYHELQTLFYPVGLYNGTPENPEPFCDIIDIYFTENTVRTEVSCSGNRINCNWESNLVNKAILKFNQSLLDKGLEIRNIGVDLYKRIPDGAGLGGGSADASFTLKTLNSLYREPFTKKELVKFASELGADCPFFIENQPVYATGIGEIMSPAEINLKGYWVVILKPDIYISTKEAFAFIKPELHPGEIPEIVKLPVESWEKAGLKNDFEPHIFKIYPLLADLKRQLYDSGALYAAMSGSGSSIYGIFEDRQSASKVYLKKKTASYLIKL